jgi:hypothetical protein
MRSFVNDFIARLAKFVVVAFVTTFLVSMALLHYS